MATAKTATTRNLLITASSIVVSCEVNHHLRFSRHHQQLQGTLQAAGQFYPRQSPRVKKKTILSPPPRGPEVAPWRPVRGPIPGPVFGPDGRPSLPPPSGSPPPGRDRDCSRPPAALDRGSGRT